jgi:hypothetical protein
MSSCSLVGEPDVDADVDVPAIGARCRRDEKRATDLEAGARDHGEAEDVHELVLDEVTARDQLAERDADLADGGIGGSSRSGIAAP